MHEAVSTAWFSGSRVLGGLVVSFFLFFSLLFLYKLNKLNL